MFDAIREVKMLFPPIDKFWAAAEDQQVVKEVDKIRQAMHPMPPLQLKMPIELALKVEPNQGWDQQAKGAGKKI